MLRVENTFRRCTSDKDFFQASDLNPQLLYWKPVMGHPCTFRVDAPSRLHFHGQAMKKFTSFGVLERFRVSGVSKGANSKAPGLSKDLFPTSSYPNDY